MTLDEAIERCEEVARSKDVSIECGVAHMQLGRWLMELQLFKAMHKAGIEVPKEMYEDNDEKNNIKKDPGIGIQEV